MKGRSSASAAWSTAICGLDTRSPPRALHALPRQLPQLLPSPPCCAAGLAGHAQTRAAALATPE
ncbi:hypothetical protein U9M48_042058 [Paspalum notatum var. saurae]|uniref:Uncharacterized protein n=1 Tax=Paspalum notatum var. saurae TaxID=547442 RepID=A0AAQ3UQC4_PASNO